MDVLANFTLANKKQTASAHAGVAQEHTALRRILIERKKSRGARAQRYFQVVFSRHSQAIAQWDVVNEPIETGYRVDGLENQSFPAKSVRPAACGQTRRATFSRPSPNLGCSS